MQVSDETQALRDRVLGFARDIGPAATTLFHDAHKTGEASLAENFSHRHCCGKTIPAFYGMTIDSRCASPDGPPPYPQMLRWQR
jgi:hypothetical protein